jgi:predicted RNA-binding Zn ribbon-like protein
MNAALELVNSEWWRGRPGGVVDKLEDPEWVSAFTEATGLGPLGQAPLRPLRDLRAALRLLVDDPDGADASALDRFVAAAPVRRRVVAGAVELEPVRRDWTWAMSEIAASLLPLLDDPSRLKTCANHQCQWSFVDESRNRSRRWCGSTTCGNADKVRRFRARQRALAAP